MRRLILGCLAVTLLGCTGNQGLDVRFQAERELWQTHRESDRIAIKPELFDDSARIALAERYEALAQRTLERAPNGSEGPLADARGIAARAWLSAAGVYGVLGDSIGTRRCFTAVRTEFTDLPRSVAEASLGEALLDESIENWTRAAQLFQDVINLVRPSAVGRGPETSVLQLPLRRARLLTQASGGEPQAEDYAEAVRYYQQFLATQPEPRLALEAHMLLADAHGDLRAWDAAIQELTTAESIAKTDTNLPWKASDIRLASALAQHRMDPESEATRQTLESIVAEYPQTDTAVRALLTLGNNALASGRHDDALAAYVRIRTDYAGPDEARAEAMVREARILDQKNRWPEARELLRAIPREHPLTLAALEAPLEEVRHYELLNDAEGTQAALADAEANYVALMERFPSMGIITLAQDKLTQVLILQDRYADAVHQLELAATRMRGQRSGAMALIRAAQISLQELADTTRAVELLEQTASWYKGSDIATQAEAQAERLRGGSQ